MANEITCHECRRTIIGVPMTNNEKAYHWECLQLLKKKGKIKEEDTIYTDSLREDRYNPYRRRFGFLQSASRYTNKQRRR